ncbi:MAG: hypothetical protein JNK11_14890 [Alphaproteobacteria bacterium]|nr:hypothetical protein [Alphaproteobacteria bacterium]
MAGLVVLVAGVALGSIAVLGAFDRPMRAALLGAWELADALPPIIGSRISFGPDGSFDLSEQRSTPQGVLENRLSGRFATRGGDEIVLDIVEPPGRAGRSIIKARLIAGTHLSLRFASGQLVYRRQ